MVKFDFSINKLLTFESVERGAHDTLDPRVFQTPTDGTFSTLHYGIKAQIITDIENLSTIVPVASFLIVGDIISPYWNDNTDIDVYVEVDAELIDNLSTAEIMYHLQNKNGRLAVGTTHKIFYHVVPHDIDISKLDAAYDVANERWKKPYNTVVPNVARFISDFNETISSIDVGTGKLLRNTIQLSELKQLGKKDIASILRSIRKKFIIVEDEVKYMAMLYADSESLKVMAMSKYLDVENILHASKRDRLPENITIKLLEKFYINKFIQKLEHLKNPTDFDLKQLTSSRVGRHFKEA